MIQEVISLLLGFNSLSLVMIALDFNPQDYHLSHVNLK